MSEELKPTYQDDEIDLVELLQTIWDGKWLIATFAAIAVVGGGAFALLKPSVFEAQTEIKPITTVHAQLYNASNSLGFFEITRGALLNSYIEYLDERSLFEDSIRKNELLDRSKFESEQDYDNAIVEMAASIELLPPINEDGTDKGESRRYWSINFEGENSQKWLAVLDDVTQSATSSVQQNLVDRFENALLVAKQSKRFKLEDLATQITNAKADFDKRMKEFELIQTFEIEDVNTQISNARLDYERKITDRLAFLNEQASIARKLGVAKNTLEAQTFSSNSGVVANVKTDTPFYLRGYEAIEKEIELIQNRQNTDAFVDGLFTLEQKKRQLIQDQTLARSEQKKTFLKDIIELENQVRNISQDKTLQRAIELFESTPVKSAEPFMAAEFDVYATDIQSKSKRSLIVALALVLGGMVGVMFVLIRSAVRNRKAKA